MKDFHNTGKVKIGLLYEPPMPRMSADMERVQAAVLPPPLSHGLSIRQALVEVLLGVSLVALPVLFWQAPAIWQAITG